MSPPAPLRLLVVGASYGLLPGIRLALAGHCVTFVGRAAEIAAMARTDLVLELPDRRGGAPIVLTCPVGAEAAPGVAALRTPETADADAADFVILAMQEPHYADPPVAALMARIAASARPCLSIMNLPPPPFLARLGSVDLARLQGVHASQAVWAGFAPGQFSLASPDPQALRLDPERPGVLTVTLPSNFKAAPFARAADQALLERLAAAMAAGKVQRGGTWQRLPVQLLAAQSLCVPLAKWPMLIAGNCRCLTEAGLRSIAQAVADDPAQSERLYTMVCDLALALGARPRDLVPFAAYARAAQGLTRPSSLARALAAGAPQVERVDLLVLRLAEQTGMATAALEPIVAGIEARLAANRSASAPAA